MISSTNRKGRTSSLAASTGNSEARLCGEFIGNERELFEAASGAHAVQSQTHALKLGIDWPATWRLAAKDRRAMEPVARHERADELPPHAILQMLVLA